MSESERPFTVASARYARWAVSVSFVLHVGLIVALLVFSLALPAWWPGIEQGDVDAILVTQLTERESPPEPEAPPVRVVSDPEEVRGEMVRERIEELAADARQMSDEDKLKRLDELSGRLSDVATEESVNRLANSLKSMLGTKSRATEPATEPVPGVFDFETAQFHDVQRYAEDDGIWRYVSVLIDGDGRRIEVDMDSKEGERVYETMQRIKSNPLLENVYRQIAMPFFDQLLSGMRQAAELGEQLEEEARAQQEAAAQRGDDPSNAAEPERSNTAEPERSHTAEPESSHTAEPESSNTAEPERSHTAEPESSDNTTERTEAANEK